MERFIIKFRRYDGENECEDHPEVIPAEWESIEDFRKQLRETVQKHEARRAENLAQWHKYNEGRNPLYELPRGQERIDALNRYDRETPKPPEMDHYFIDFGGHRFWRPDLVSGLDEYIEPTILTWEEWLAEAGFRQNKGSEAQ